MPAKQIQDSNLLVLHPFCYYYYKLFACGEATPADVQERSRNPALSVTHTACQPTKSCQSHQRLVDAGESQADTRVSLALLVPALQHAARPIKSKKQSTCRSGSQAPLALHSSPILSGNQFCSEPLL